MPAQSLLRLVGWTNCGKERLHRCSWPSTPHLNYPAATLTDLAVAILSPCHVVKFQQDRQQPRRLSKGRPYSQCACRLGRFGQDTALSSGHMPLVRHAGPASIIMTYSSRSAVVPIRSQRGTPPRLPLIGYARVAASTAAQWAGSTVLLELPAVDRRSTGNMGTLDTGDMPRDAFKDVPTPSLDKARKYSQNTARGFHMEDTMATKILRTMLLPAWILWHSIAGLLRKACQSNKRSEPNESKRKYASIRGIPTRVPTTRSPAPSSK